MEQTGAVPNRRRWRKRTLVSLAIVLGLLVGGTSTSP